MTDAMSIAKILAKGRYRLGSEGLLQNDIAAHLDRYQIVFEREVRLGPADRIDFLAVESIGIEVKAKAIARHIFRQLSRYAEYERLTALILISNTAMGLPPTIAGKPIYFVSLGRCML